MAGKMHVVMLPWSAFGHMIPFFHLAIAIAKAGIRVSLVSTPRNIQRLLKPPPNLSSLIKFVELPFPVMENGSILPEGAEATVDMPFEKIQYLKAALDLLQHPFKQYYLKAALDLLQHPFKQYVADTSPDWIIIDFFSHWVSSIAREHGVPLVYFSGYEAKAVYSGFFTDNASGTTDAARYVEIINSCQAVAVRSCVEEIQINDGSWGENFKWLNEQKPKSVVFVGFGSECKLTKDQVHEIAYGLELSELPFLWALRKPNWAIEDADALPSGFSDRTSGRGMVCMGWAPQMEILEHPSIGGSLFHSGWGSVIETLQFAHCLVVLPIIIDQGLNARLLVEKGLAVEVERREDGTFSREDITKSLRLAMVSEEGEKLRIHAKGAAAIFGDPKLHQDHYIGGFVEYLKNGIAKQNWGFHKVFLQIFEPHLLHVMAGNMHVVMVPWLAFGHMIPHLQLAIALAEAGIHVSFISTPRNIQRLPKLSPTLLPLINLVALPLPAVLGLPEGCEATVELPFEKIKYLKIAYALLKQPLKRFLEGASPDWMIVDLPVDWAAEAARECAVPLLAFTMFTSASNVFFGPPEYLTGFGSECKLSQDQVHEIAYGLELSELTFLWALRKPNWAIEDVDALPSGYSDRTSGRGVVCMEWAPQMEILAHPSIGGSLFHSGWGSAIETMQFGHCPIVLPFVIDQGLNARLLVEKGMAVEIERGDDGSFSRDDIAKSLRLAMVMEEGEKLRIRAREVAMIFGDQKLHQSYIDELVKYLKGGIAKEK
ncbi:unnamed protein product, partial [Vitis vinifera]